MTVKNCNVMLGLVKEKFRQKYIQKTVVVISSRKPFLWKLFGTPVSFTITWFIKKQQLPFCFGFTSVHPVPEIWVTSSVESSFLIALRSTSRNVLSKTMSYSNAKKMKENAIFYMITTDLYRHLHDTIIGDLP